MSRKHADNKHTIEPDTTEPLESEVTTSDAKPSASPKQSHVQRVKQWVKLHKVWSVVIGVLFILVVTSVVVGFTDLRFTVLNLFSHSTLNITVTDSKTNQIIPGATVTIGSTKQKADTKGLVKFNTVAWGDTNVTVEKIGYTTSASVVKVDASPKNTKIALIPSGTPLTFTVTNTITGAILTGAKVSFATADAISNDRGIAVLRVAPQQVDSIDVKVDLDGYNSTTVKAVIDPSKPTTVSLAPAGQIYFLSKRTGKINVMRSNLDGTNQSVVLAGTGHENDDSTILLASRDWKYLALLSRRDAKNTNGQLYLIDTTSGAVSTIDDASNANISSVGWHDHTFVYTKFPTGQEYWQTNTTIRSFNADSKKNVAVDTTQSTGTSQFDARLQYFTSIYIVDGGLVYGTYRSNNPDQQQQLITINVDGSNKKVVANYSSNEVIGLDARSYEPNSIYFYLSTNNDTNKVVAVENGALKSTNVSVSDYQQVFYKTYLVSPTGKSTFWYEPRDGKKTLLVGDANGDNGKTIVDLGEYTAYGWYTDNYLLVSKGDSELFILSKDGQKTPFKISDYHKPNFSGAGYGYGYGAF